MSLLLKECKKVLFSLTFIAFTICVLFIFITQFYPLLEEFGKPSPDEYYFGNTTIEDEHIIMSNALNSLLTEYSTNSYGCYPLGFYRDKKLNEKKSQKIFDILIELSDKSYDEILEYRDKLEKGEIVGYGMTGVLYSENGSMTYLTSETLLNVGADVTGEQFYDGMKRVSKIIGMGSKYSKNMFAANFASIPSTYEDAVEEYNIVIEKDKITGAFARLFCDYINIFTSIFPIFIAIAVCLKDRRNKTDDLIYSRKTSSFKLLFTRFFAIVIICMLTVLILAAFSTLGIHLNFSDMNIEYTSIFTLSLIWITPSVMISTAIGMIITTLTNSAVGIGIYGFIWYINMFLSMQYMNGGFNSLLIVLRHNTLGGSQIFYDNFYSMVFNRIFYAALSLILVALTCAIYELKRRGIFNGIKLKRSKPYADNIKIQSQI